MAKCVLMIIRCGDLIRCGEGEGLHIKRHGKLAAAVRL